MEAQDMTNAIQAYGRLVKTFEAVAEDPFHPGATEALTNAAYEANHAMAKIGLAERRERPTD